MPLEPNGQAPYAPAATVLDVINRYRERGLHTPFSVEVLMRAGVAESLAGRTFQSLRLLDLIDDEGNPSAEFEVLRSAPTDEFKDRFQDVLRAIYADVFQFTDPTIDSPERVSDAFRDYKPSGQRNRMVTLFLGLCEAAGIIMEAPRRTRTTSERPARRAPAPRKKTPKNSGTSSTHRKETNYPPELTGLLNSLPDRSVGWTKVRRDHFLQAFGVVLDFVIPLHEEDEIQGLSNQEEGAL